MNILGNICRRIKSWVAAQIASHESNADAHHAKYTNTEAVAALAVADPYVKNTGDKMTGDLRVDVGSVNLYDRNNNVGAMRSYNIWRSRLTGVSVVGDKVTYCNLAFHNGSVYKNSGQIKAVLKQISADLAAADFGFYFFDNNGNQRHFIGTAAGEFEINNLIIKNPKNHAYSALSGAKKLIEIDIGGIPYYLEVYPTKA